DDPARGFESGRRDAHAGPVGPRAQGSQVIRLVRLVLVALTALVGGFACDRSPTGLPQPGRPSALLESASRSQTAPTRAVWRAPLPGEPHRFSPMSARPALSSLRQATRH